MDPACTKIPTIWTHMRVLYFTTQPTCIFLLTTWKISQCLSKRQPGPTWTLTHTPRPTQIITQINHCQETKQSQVWVWMCVHVSGLNSDAEYRTTHNANFSSRSGTFSHSEERQEVAFAKLRMATVYTSSRGSGSSSVFHRPTFSTRTYNINVNKLWGEGVGGESINSCSL